MPGLASSLIERKGGKRMNNDRLLTISEASRKLNISKSTLYKYIRNRDIRAYKLGNCIRVKESDLNEWLNSNITK